jgi:hypothetical protein
VVLRRQAGAHVDDEDHRIGLGHGLARLLGHLGDDAAGLVGLEAAGVDDDELAPAQAGVAVVAVARQAGEVGHDGVAALGDAVEQRGLADVGPADEGDDRLHGRAARRGRAQFGRKANSRRCAWSRAACCRPAPARRRRLAVGGQAQLRLAVGARQEVHLPSRSPKTTAGPPPAAPLRPRCSSARWSRATSPWRRARR